jgi:hypothetical protein
MRIAPNRIPENIEFAAQELLEAPADQQPAMLENIAKVLTRRLLKGNPPHRDSRSENASRHSSTLFARVSNKL